MTPATIESDQPLARRESEQQQRDRRAKHQAMLEDHRSAKRVRQARHRQRNLILTLHP